jgi:hypothetical protein
METKFRTNYCLTCGDIAPFLCNNISYCYKCIHNTDKPINKKPVKTNEELMMEREIQRRNKINRLKTLYKQIEELLRQIDSYNNVDTLRALNIESIKVLDQL